MAEEIMLNNYSDDSQIKKYIQNILMPKVFKDIPINILNTGAFSIMSEYMSQAIENMAFTSSFYFNESYITKAVLPDSIYSEAAIFNIGYAFAKKKRIMPASHEESFILSLISSVDMPLSWRSLTEVAIPSSIPLSYP